ncbi:hypothetical protein ACTWPB_22670 [Nocardia sp. IBHARD005]|uniref:hypothetical protein n=1 Tax=Nocardia sp. IBHARD005 TaxID=3457765 RepID=UPI00405A45B0
MTEPVFAYYRRPLAHDRIWSVEARIAEVASFYGCDDLAGRIFVEFESPIRLLWSLGEFLDQRVDAKIAEHVRDLARAHGYEYDRMHSYPTPAPALWQLIAALEAAGDGIVLIPSLHHLADLEVTETQIMQHFSANLNARVVWTDPVTGNARQTYERRPDLADSPTRLLGEFRVSPFCAALRMARVNCEEFLARAGLAALTGTIDDLMVAIVGPAEQRWSGNIDMLDEWLIIRLIRPARSHLLVVEVAEAHDHGDAPFDTLLRRICDSGIGVRRESVSSGGTVTRYEVRIPDAVRR